MKIAICTIGSTGDIQPYLALALSLREAGFPVKVISHPFHQPRFEAHGLEFAACGPVVSQQELNEMLDRMLSYRNPIRQLRLLMNEAFFADGENYFHSAKAALQDCDLAVCHMVDFLGSEAAAQLNMPRIGGILAPAGIPTAWDVPPGMPRLG
jgi:UDP:flavonoid glycosyltransferase YjiC (YdhE family)